MKCSEGRMKANSVRVQTGEGGGVAVGVVRSRGRGNTLNLIPSLRAIS